MTIAETIKMNANQYLQLGEDPPGIRLELVNGEIRVSPSPSTPHAYALSQLLRLLGNHVEQHGLGIVMSDTDHVLEEFTVRRPDIYFFSTARVALIGEGAIRHPPDLGVEIISPGSQRTDREEKFGEYAAFFMRHYWLVDPQRRTAEAFVLKRKKYVATGYGQRHGTVRFPPFEDLAIDLAKLWWPPKNS